MTTHQHGASRRDPASSGRVVVVGAGLAGLTAAHELSQAGWQVTVLEARDRVGGRVHTLHAPFSGHQHAEAGAEFIDAVHTELQRCLGRFGLETEPVAAGFDRSATRYYLNGRRFTDRELEEVVGRSVVAAADRFWDAVDELARLLAGPGQAAAQAGLDGRSVADLIDSLELHPGAHSLITFDFRGQYAVEPADLSLLDLVQDTAEYTGVPEADLEAYRVRGGNSQLPAALAAALGPAVRLSAPVTAVRATAEGLVVSHVHGEITADYAVLAAPLPALRRVAFTPPLPEPLARAVAGLGYGVVTKVVLQYAARFWRDGYPCWQMATDLPIGVVYETTDQQSGQEGILVAYVAGKLDQNFRSQPEAGRVATAVDQIEQLYPGSRALFRAGRALSWAAEPFSGGAYSAPRPGQVLAFPPPIWDAVGPAGRLYFAGEHTAAQYAGYMEGAIRSGRRVARHIIAGLA